MDKLCNYPFDNSLTSILKTNFKLTITLEGGACKGGEESACRWQPFM